MDREPKEKLAPQYLTGIPGIDMQHTELFFFCSKLLGNLKDGSFSPDLASESVKEILEGLEAHYLTEEILLDMIDFPRMAEHKTKHEKILNEVKDNIGAFSTANAVEMGRIIRAFRDNLLTHISVFDREYVLHVENIISLKEKFKITALKARSIAG